MANQDRVEIWRQRLVDFAQNGATVSVWCQQNGIPTRRFYYWRQQLARAGAALPATDWLSLPAVEQPQQSDCITLKIAGAEIDVRSGFNVDLLRCVVQALGASRC